MPVKLDRGQRLDAIAKSTLQLAHEAGPAAITMRAVAERLGGSTTLITKHVPSRAALLANAFRFVADRWAVGQLTALHGRSGFDRLRALADWSLTTDEDEAAIRGLWLEALATRQRDRNGVDLPTMQAHDELGKIRAVVAQAADGGDHLADALFLAFRGFYVSSVEDPEQWPAERARAALHWMLDLVQAEEGTALTGPGGDAVAPA